MTTTIFGVWGFPPPFISHDEGGNVYISWSFEGRHLCLETDAGNLWINLRGKCKSEDMVWEYQEWKEAAEKALNILKEWGMT